MKMPWKWTRHREGRETVGRQWVTELAAWSCGITVTGQRMTGTRMLEIVISTWCSDGA